MKTSRIQRSLVSVVFTAITLAASAQQEHQTYSGPFGRDNAGTATYSYYTGADGRRMFDGKYTYKRTESRNGGSTYTETGQYKDDKLDGLWTLSFNSSINSMKIVAKITLNYKDGVLHGPMNYSWKETESGTTTKQYTLQFHEGYLTGKQSNIVLDMSLLSYEFDENHRPNGLWTYQLNRPSTTYRHCLRYDHGQLVESYTEHLSTGDRTGQFKVEDDQVARPLMQEINKLLQQPYGYKEMPVRSSLSPEQQAANNAAINAEASKFGFLGYPGYGKH